MIRKLLCRLGFHKIELVLKKPVPLYTCKYCKYTELLYTYPYDNPKTK
jgi:hypothetical protein